MFSSQVPATARQAQTESSTAENLTRREENFTLGEKREEEGQTDKTNTFSRIKRGAAHEALRLVLQYVRSETVRLT